MTNHDLNEVNRLREQLPEIKAAINLLEGGIIASLNVRKFDHKICNYKDTILDFKIPRGVLKDAYLLVLKDKLHYTLGKIDSLMKPEPTKESVIPETEKQVIGTIGMMKFPEFVPRGFVHHA